MTLSSPNGSPSNYFLRLSLTKVTMFSPVLFHILHKTLILQTVGFILGATVTVAQEGLF